MAAMDGHVVKAASERLTIGERAKALQGSSRRLLESKVRVGVTETESCLVAVGRV